MNIFTKNDYRKIQAWLKANSIKDSDFTLVNDTIPEEDTLVLVQKINGILSNVKISIKNLINSTLSKVIIDTIIANAVKVNNILTVTASNVKIDNEKGTTLQDIIDWTETIEKVAKGWNIEYQVPSIDEPTVRAKYVLKDSKGVPKGDVIKVYKDSAITNVYLGTTKDTCNENTGEVTKEPVQNNNEALSIVYRLDTGKYSLVNVPIGIFTREAEFDKYKGLGVTENGQVFIKLASDIESSNYLHFNELGEITANGIETRILKDLGNIITSVANDGTMWGQYKKEEGTKDSPINEASRWGQYKQAEADRSGLLNIVSSKVNQLEQEQIQGGVYDVSTHNDGAVFESLQALLSSSNLSALIPTSVRHGGMSIRFIQGSDNKYVQYRLMSDAFNTTLANWQGVDDEPTAGSDNLVKSGGIKQSLTNFEKLHGWIAETSIKRVSESTYYAIEVNGGENLYIKSKTTNTTNIAFAKTLVKNQIQDIDFATGYSARFSINPNNQVYLLIPDDCRYLLVNDLYSSDPLNTSDLPVSLQINGYEFISASLNKSIVSKTEENIAEKYAGWVGSTSLSEKSDAYFFVIRNNQNEKISIVSNKHDAAQIAFVTELGGITAQSLSFATGYSARVEIPKDTATEISIPSDCKYILVNGKYNSSSPSAAPLSVNIDGVEIIGFSDGIKQVYERLKGDEYIIKESSSIIDQFSTNSIINGWLTTAGTIETNSKRQMLAIKVSVGDTLKIKASSNGSHIVFAKTFDDVNKTFTFSSKYGSRISISANDEVQYYIPNDCTYLLVNYSYDSVTMSYPAKLEINGFDYTKNIRETVIDRANSIDNVKYPIGLGEGINKPTSDSHTFTSNTGYSTFSFKISKGLSIEVFCKVINSATCRFVFSSALPSVGGTYEYLDALDVAAGKTGTFAYTASSDGYLSVNIWSANVDIVLAREINKTLSDFIMAMHNIDLASAIRKGNGSTRAEKQMDSMLSIVHLTDSHNDWERVKRGFQVASAFGITLCHTGDFVKNSTDNIQKLSNLLDEFENTKYIECLGNHDVWNYTTRHEVYSKYIAPLYSKSNCLWQLPSGINNPTFFYKDDSAYKVRYISVDQWRRESDQTGGQYYIAWSQEQIDFVIDTLLNVPQGYGVIILQHTPEGTISKTADYSKFYQGSENYTECTYEPIKAIVDTFISKTTINTSIDTSRETLSLVADFTNVASNEFIAYITGHLHKDLVHYAIGTTNRQLVLNETCTICKISADGDSYGEDADLGRDKNSTTQDAFNVYAIDRLNKCIRIARIGSDMPITFAERRDYMVIPYI